ncbi:Hypothetical protein NTJ_02671 [Nesidiocoris tenuis]|uniref:PiggyBac transposable element-derived protein domain-containing protein n=1 Tax=Nesidiocoris tenuis TaxID=355587 RepID=A0ABN7AFC7_9HEMI|nr:Hypothetical protein NTJ_02671 [Nesidiocoris tenuis]
MPGDTQGATRIIYGSTDQIGGEHSPKNEKDDGPEAARGAASSKTHLEGKSKKLSKRWSGPFKIIRVLNKQNAILKVNRREVVTPQICLPSGKQSLTTTWYAEIPIMMPRLHKREYITHANKYTKPVLVYAITSHTGNEPIDHWYSWSAIEGREGENVMYVQGGKNTAGGDKKCDCSNFLELPKSLCQQ